MLLWVTMTTLVLLLYYMYVKRKDVMIKLSLRLKERSVFIFSETLPHPFIKLNQKYFYMSLKGQKYSIYAFNLDKNKHYSWVDQPFICVCHSLKKLILDSQSIFAPQYSWNTAKDGIKHQSINQSINFQDFIKGDSPIMFWIQIDEKCYNI